jgi:hypothetical protein
MAEYGCRDISHTKDAGNDGIRNLEAPRGARESQTQTAVDDAEDNEHLAVNDVGIAEDGPLLVLLVLQVMDPAEGGLYAQQGDDDCAESGVCLLKEL